MESAIPNEVQQFIAKYIRSLDQLEVLLLVGALPDREWSANEVYEVVRSNPAVVAQRLDELVKFGLLSRAGDPPLYRYAPRTEELCEQVSVLSGIYKMSRHRIVELIYAGEKSDSLKGFSDAFRFKREQ